ncbi:MAG: hypothetical protein NTW59_00355 [Candidatus Diapherotrites archaeon]|nr:hypothetical protein [Candidatus Diapherotrites archaeon]
MLEKTGDKIIALVIVFAITGIAFYLLYTQQQAQPMEEEPVIDLGDTPFAEEGAYASDTAPIAGTCNQQPTQLDHDLCWLYQAADEGNVDLCSNIDDNSTKITCIAGIAVDTTNKNICGRLNYNEALFYWCITGIAKDMGEYSYCETMPDFYKRKCVLQVDQELGVATD